MREKFSSIERVIGSKNINVSEEEKQEVLGGMETIFQNQSQYKKELLEAYGEVENIPDEFIRPIFFEREKTSEEKQIINLANKETNQLRKKFNLPELNIPLENVYVVPEEAPWPENFQIQSYYNSLGQFIVISEERIKKLNNSKLVFAEELFHEMIHFKSFNSLRKLEDSSYEGYKSGLKAHKKNEENLSYFGDLDDAVVEELTISLINGLKEDSLFKKEVEQTAEIKKYLSNQKITGGKPLIEGDEYYMNIDEETSMLWSAHFSRKKERKILDKLIEKILESSNNDYNFKNREEIFNFFVEAVITGSIINLGRLVDKSFGKKTFRNIAELDGDIDQQEKYIDSLK